MYFADTLSTAPLQQNSRDEVLSVEMEIEETQMAEFLLIQSTNLETKYTKAMRQLHTSPLESRQWVAWD